MTTSLPQRHEVALEDTWNLTSVYADQAAWEADANALTAAVPGLAQYLGRLDDGATLLALFEEAQRLYVLAGRVLLYASMRFDVNTTDQVAAGLRGRAISLYVSLESAIAFVDPELLGLGAERLAALRASEPALARYDHYVENLLRRGPYVRSAEVERLLAQAHDPLSASYSAYLMLAEGELRFAEAQDAQGQRHQVAPGTIDALLQSPDRTLRQQAWASHQDGFVAFKNTLGAIYSGSVRTDVFNAHARGYASVLEASLFRNNIPRVVYEQVLDACQRHSSIWHRYWALKRRALGLERFEAYDVFAPLAPSPQYRFDEAVELLCDAFAPLGDTYVATVRSGLNEGRWVDRYPNQGKQSGAYSAGSYGTHPFILMNYDGTLSSVSTLAHELGHSLHTWHANATQPPIYANYSLFVAEVASNFNQALMRAHLLKQNLSRDVEIAVLEEAMANFHRYFFLMPLLSEFEQRVHTMAEAHEPLTADGMSAIMHELFVRGYGPEGYADPVRDGIVWAQFPHLYSCYYVYQYASGIAAANALAELVLHGGNDARERYLACLRAGGSVYPLEALRRAGIDMSTPAPLEQAFGVLERFVSRLEQLVSGA
ncbi:oligoendopeptidase F [Candidatus Viridilinea mediisalina]|uniref:Oligopeptidase F n=1 Tax=Candidatus Viridilinea mediisalina TaxID=2024553 RepID=A0A2A6RMK0_9CHLR|nr:oligoendopeptidase F [Candidatus Viridilinea mediisalina]PDW04146.1 oligoendopeptidase F [Candidatus Viridilinea mediisalina]